MPGLILLAVAEVVRRGRTLRDELDTASDTTTGRASGGVHLDRLLVEHGMSLTDLAAQVGPRLANLSVLQPEPGPGPAGRQVQRRRVLSVRRRVCHHRDAGGESGDLLQV
jgi:hypothetical protein